MAIHPDIKKAIEIIDQRIESLRHIRDSLAKEFGMDEVVKPTAPTFRLEPESRLLPLNGDHGKTSKDMIEDFLATHEPASRKQIIVGTGIKTGTVSFALNDKKRFKRGEHGWVRLRTHLEHTA